jgi:hypothetical protein
MKKIYTHLVILLFYLVAFSTLCIAKDTTAVNAPVNKPADDKICSCQLMNVQATKNSRDHLVAIFAEKTRKGKDIINYKLMDEYIRKEKIYFKIVFIRSLEVQKRIKSKSDCLTLYTKVKAANEDVKLYNIINVDVLSSVVKR